MRAVAMLSVCLLFVAVLAAPTAFASDTPQEALGKVTEVTLYRGQAMVTRTIPLGGPAGSIEVVVGNLPERVIADSLFAEGAEGIEVRAVRFRTRAVSEAPREEVSELDKNIKKVQRDIQGNRSQRDLLNKRGAYLDKLEEFTATTATTDLSQGLLDAEALQKISEYSFEKRKEIADEDLALQEKAKELDEDLSLLVRKRAELTNGSTQTVREALLFLQKHTPGQSSAKLNYLVGGCGWSPTYTFRASEDGSNATVECSALIQQMSGEDWDGVKLSLSTASPALSAAGPGLAPFPVTLTREPGDQQLNERDLTAQVQSILGRQSAAIVQNRRAQSMGENIGASWAANAAAFDLQNLELNSDKKVLSMLAVEGIQDGEGPSLGYELDGPVSLASRSDQQMVRILQTEFDGQFYHVATPVLTSYVYREAELKNDSDLDLLAGPSTVYLDGRFVGRGEIPTVARGQSFVVSFGANPQLRAKRELADRTEETQGGNRELNLSYRLVVENYKEEDVPIRVFDRLPYSDRPGEVRITLGELEDPLSTDGLYLRTERPKGILRWEIDVPSGSIGKDARLIEYAFTVAFDRNFQLTATTATQPSAAVEQQKEFEMLQRGRAGGMGGMMFRSQ